MRQLLSVNKETDKIRWPRFCCRSKPKILERVGIKVKTKQMMKIIRSHPPGARWIFPVNKCIWYVLAVLLFAGTSHAQVSSQIIGPTSGSSTSASGPYFAQSGSGFFVATRNAYLYTEAELNIPAGAVIREIAWLKKNGTVSGNNVFNLWLGNSPADWNYFEKDLVKWSDLVTRTGAVQVYKDSNRAMTAAGDSWETFPLQQRFVYTGGSMVIFTDWYRTGAVTGSPNTFYVESKGKFRAYMTGSTAALTDSVYIGTDGLSSGGNLRAAIRITYELPGAYNNASVLSTSGWAHLCAGTYPLKATVRNNGVNKLDSVQLNWEVDGAARPAVVHRTPIDTFGSVAGNTAEVTLGDLALSDTVKTVRIWTSRPNGGTDTVHYDDTLRVAVRASLNGTYTVGGAAPHYQSVSESVKDLNKYGVCGPVTILIRPGVYVEPERLTLQGIYGLSAANRVTFRSESGVPSSVAITTHDTAMAVSTYSSVKKLGYVMSLRGTSYITFKDLSLVSRSHDVSNLTSVLNWTGYYAVGTAANPDTVYKVSIDSVSIDNCVLKFESQTASSSENVLNFDPSFAAAAGNKGVYVANSLFDGGALAVVIGSGSTLTFEHNRVLNARRDAVTLSAPLLKCNSNTIEETNGRKGMVLTAYDGASEVRGNKISVTSTGTNEARGLEVRRVGGTSMPPLIIANNAIIVAAAGTGNAYGIYSEQGVNVHYYHNSVYNNTTTGSDRYAGYFNHTSADQQVTVMNNVFVTKASGSVISFADPAYCLSDYNNAYGPSGYWTKANVTIPGIPFPIQMDVDLDGWRSASGRDRHSISYNPGFTSATDLTPNPADSASWSLNGRGVHLADVATDINGTARPATRSTGAPDIGAYEFTPVSIPPRATATPALPGANQQQLFLFGGDTVARLDWGSTVPASAVTVRQYSGETAPDLGAGNVPRYMYFHTSIEGPSGGYSYTANLRYRNTWLGTLDNEQRVRMARRQGTNPWTFFPGAASSVDTLANTITAPALTSFGLYTGSDTTGTVYCAGQPQALVITNSSGGLCSGLTITLDANNPNQNTGSTVTGYTFRWEQSATGSAPWVAVSGGTGAASLHYTTPGLTTTTWYRAIITCAGSGQSATGTPFKVQVAEPGQITGTTPGGHCGAGTVTLGATARTRDTLNWYPSASGGTPIGTGNTYATPLLSATTIYYVAASADGVCESTRVPVMATIHSFPPATVTAGGNIIITPSGDITTCASDSVLFTANAGMGYTYQWQRNGNDINGAVQQEYAARESGRYKVVVTDTNGCSSTSAEENVIIYSLPQPDIRVNGASLETDNFATYQWYRDGQAISGATGQTHVPAGDGGYSVLVTDNNGCEGISSVYSYRVGVGIVEKDYHITVYPNPADDRVYIASSVPVHVSVLGVDGRVVLMEANTRSINISGLANGLYTLRITDAEGILLKVEQLVKQRRR